MPTPQFRILSPGRAPAYPVGYTEAALTFREMSRHRSEAPHSLWERPQADEGEWLLVSLANPNPGTPKDYFTTKAFSPRFHLSAATRSALHDLGITAPDNGPEYKPTTRGSKAKAPTGRIVRTKNGDPAPRTLAGRFTESPGQRTAN